MADVRSSDGIPLSGAFSGVQTPSPGTPVIVNTQTGDLYVLLTGGVTKALSVSVVSGLMYGAGVPDNAAGSNGNFYFRSDGTAGTFIYHKAAGAWTAFV